MTETKVEGSKSTNPLSWRLADLPSVTDASPKVVSTFSCGGGSSMGYKLAGFNVVGAVDIDPEMMELYRENFDPLDSVVCGVGEVIEKRPDLIEKWRGVDILDGSPPCTSFSIAGLRGQTWGKERFFREGQAVQVLDQLFFDFLNLANELQPKIIVAENVQGMIKGSARGYVSKVVEVGREYGYEFQIIKMNASDQGVPQTRPRLFFIGRRLDLDLPPLSPIPPKAFVTAGEAISDLTHDCVESIDKCPHALYPSRVAFWNLMQKYGYRGAAARYEKVTGYKYFASNLFCLYKDQASLTLISGGGYMWAHEKRTPTHEEYLRLSSFPDDYAGLSAPNDTRYVVGMSVPPRMMQGVAEHLQEEWNL